MQVQDHRGCPPAEMAETYYPMCFKSNAPVASKKCNFQLHRLLVEALKAHQTKQPKTQWYILQLKALKPNKSLTLTKVQAAKIHALAQRNGQTDLDG